MAGVPLTISGVLYDKLNRTQQSVTLIGIASVTGLTIGGGPILPPDEIPPVEPPLETWPPSDAHPEHPIVIPPDLPPVTPPDPPPPPHEGWNWKPSTADSPEAGWYYVYVPQHHGTAGPKRKR